MTVLGLTAQDLNFPKKFQQIQGIISYFKDIKNFREKLLKITAGKTGEEKLDLAWSYVQLQNERADKLRQIGGDDLELDIEKQIKDGYLTKDKMSLLKKDASARAKEEQIKLDGLKAQKKADKSYEVELQKATSKLERYKKIETTLEEVDLINRTLNYE